MSLTYRDDLLISAGQFIDLLRRSTLAERRPVGDRARIEAMLANANLLVTAWDGAVIVGAARSVTDFAYCCYLSDLAVDAAWQRRGVGKELIRRTQARLHPEASLILLSAPKATEYYPRVGFRPHPSAWLIRAGDAVG